MANRSVDDLEARVRELEDQLAASEHRYAELLRGIMHLPNGVEIYDRTGLAAYLNPAMVQMTGLPSAEVALGKFNILTDAFSIETGLKPLYDRAYAGEVVRTPEFVIEMERASEDWGTSARQIWFKMVLVPLYDRSGAVDSVFAIMFETTEDRRTKKALELVSRRDGIELLAGGVAHDYNNLLTAIVTNSELVREISTDADVLDLNEDILGASEQATFLTRQLLDYTGKRRHRVETVDLRDLTQSITRAFRNALLQVGRLELDLADTPCLAEVEPGTYKQVVMNVLTNAMQALPPEGGLVTVSLQEATLDAGALEGFQFQDAPTPGTWNLLEVRDNGCGMPPEVLGRIFEPYFTTKGTGSGLGLSSALGIIWGHGGGVSIDSVEGEGTRFRIALPLSQRSLPEDTVQPLEAVLPAGAHILLADNSPFLRGSLRALLERTGVRVTEAADGEDALARLASAQRPPDLALLDFMMPGLNGLDVLRAIRGEDSALPVLLMSTHADMGRRAAADDPATGFIEKPFAPAALLRSLSALLGSGA